MGRYGGIALESFRRETAVTSAAYVEIDAVVAKDVSRVQIQNSMDQDIIIALGAAGSEVDLLHIAQGAATTPTVLDMPMLIPLGSRIAAKAADSDTTSGRLIINLWG